MKTFLKQYLVTWIKLLVMLPGVTLCYLSNFVVNAYTLISAVILGDGKTYDDVLNDMIDRIR